MGVLAEVGTRRFRFGGRKEDVSVGIGQIGGDEQGGGNAPGNDDGTGMRTGVQSSNLTY